MSKLLTECVYEHRRMCTNVMSPLSVNILAMKSPLLSPSIYYPI